ncbi:MAG: hypothetical protein JWN48_5196 [Myxococcaceae bacterium]|nr:hypothetical protein [Myxococcaceae bacterium]
MSELSFLGLGPMGMALARAARGAQRQVTVWNRTLFKAEPLRAEDDQLPNFMASFFERGRRRGLGDQSPAALVKIMRESARGQS